MQKTFHPCPLLSLFLDLNPWTLILKLFGLNILTNALTPPMRIALSDFSALANIPLIVLFSSLPLLPSIPLIVLFDPLTLPQLEFLILEFLIDISFLLRFITLIDLNLIL